jgi:hypothetical protein
MNNCQVSEVVEKNREEEQRLRKDKTRMESTLNATIAKYDEDMASRSKTLQVKCSSQAHRRLYWQESEIDCISDVDRI